MEQHNGIEALLRHDSVALAHPDALALRGRISYALAGPPDAPAITLIPGGSGAVPGSAMTAVWRALSMDNRALIVETLGAPSVTMDPRGFTTLDMARGIAGLLDWLGLEHTVVVGASLGSMIGQHLAVELGDRCRGAVLALSTAGGDSFFRELMLYLAHVGRHHPADVSRATALWAAGGEGFDRWADLLATDDLPAGDLSDDDAPDDDAPPRAEPPPSAERLARRFEACAHHDAREHLSALRCPSLVIAAGNDLMLRPALGRDLARRLPNSSFEIWQGASHMCLNEDPARFAARCRAFVEELQATGGS